MPADTTCPMCGCVFRRPDAHDRFTLWAFDVCADCRGSLTALFADLHPKDHGHVRGWITRNVFQRTKNWRRQVREATSWDAPAMRAQALRRIGAADAR